MASNLESLPSKLLFKIFLPISKEFDNPSEISEKVFDYYGDKLRDKIYERGKLIGLHSNDYEGLDFVVRLMELNFDKFYSDTLEGDLEIPESKKYSVIFKVDETQYVTNYWQVEIESYSETNAENSSRWLSSTGDLEWYSGRQIDTDYHDTETNEVSIDSVEVINESVKKVKSIVEKSDKKTLERLKKLIEERISKV